MQKLGMKVRFCLKGLDNAISDNMDVIKLFSA
jgi:hypothetical protein